MSTIMSQAWKVVKPHVPLIRFRKGGPSSAGNSSEAAAATGAPRAAAPKVIAGQQRPVIEDYQLPNRYKRLTLDENEINAINSGGAY